MVALMNLDKATGLTVDMCAAGRGYDDGVCVRSSRTEGSKRPSSCADSERPRKTPTKIDD